MEDINDAIGAGIATEDQTETRTSEDRRDSYRHSGQGYSNRSMATEAYALSRRKVQEKKVMTMPKVRSSE